MADMMSRIKRAALRSYRPVHGTATDNEDNSGGDVLNGAGVAYGDQATVSGMADSSGANMCRNSRVLPPIPIDLITNMPKFNAIECTGDMPTPRSGHIAVIDRPGVNMYIFGGYHDGRCFNDLYRLHLPTRAWTCINCTGDLPTPRVSHQAVMDGEHIMVFGYVLGGGLFS